MFVMHHCLVPVFFMGKALGTRGQGRVWQRHNIHVKLGSSWVSRAVTVKSGVAYFT